MTRLYKLSYLIIAFTLLGQTNARALDNTADDTSKSAIVGAPAPAIQNNAAQAIPVTPAPPVNAVTSPAKIIPATPAPAPVVDKPLKSIENLDLKTTDTQTAPVPVTPVKPADIKSPDDDKNLINKSLPLKSVANGVQPSDSALRKTKELAPPEFNRSLMFKQDDINKLRMVHKVYLDRLKNMQAAIKPIQDNKGDDILSKLGATTPASELPNAPTNIYLSSILFRSVGNASAWINDKRYEAGTTTDNIKVLNITSNTAEIEWQLGNYKDTDINDWLAVFPEVIDKQAIQKQPPSRSNIEVQASSRTIHFTLKPNQYLDIQGKAIHEGKPKSASKDTKGTKDAKDDKSAPPPAKPDDAKAAASEKSETTPDNKKQISYKVSAEGHYDITATINGQIIEFRYDPGATYPVISSDDAKRIGIDTSKLAYDNNAIVANGAGVKTAETKLDAMKLGDMEFKDVNIMVANGPFPHPLLGASFLNRPDITINSSNNTLTIIQSAPPSITDVVKPEETGPVHIGPTDMGTQILNNTPPINPITPPTANKSLAN